MGDYVDEHGVGRNHTARELMHMSNELTAAARLREKHRQGRRFCHFCGEAWPCAPERVLTAADAMARALARVRAHLLAQTGDLSDAEWDHWEKDIVENCDSPNSGCAAVKEADDALSLARACGLGGDDGE